jgi:hypothetical protein
MRNISEVARRNGVDGGTVQQLNALKKCRKTFFGSSKAVRSDVRNDDDDRAGNAGFAFS